MNPAKKPAETNQPIQGPISERVDLLFEELELAVKWNRPSLLLAVYRSEIVRNEAEARLSAKCSKIEQGVYPFQVSKEQFDIPLFLRQHPLRKETIFFVSGLRWGGGKGSRNAYRALNIRREFFVDHKIRAVFWLTLKEASDLPNFAPDFWAFRHRVIEFTELPERINSLGQKGNITGKAQIESREEDITSLKLENYKNPGDVNTLGSLAFTQLTMGQIQKAVNTCKQAIEINPDSSTAWNNIGKVYHKLGLLDDAVLAYNKSMKFGSDDQYNILLNLAEIYRELNRPIEATKAFRKATRIDPSSLELWLDLGRLHLDQFQYSKAVRAFNRALAVDPDFPIIHLFLAFSYQKTGAKRKAKRHIEAARKGIGSSDHYLKSQLAVFSGNNDEALNSLSLALENAEISVDQIRQNPVFENLNEEPMYKRLLANKV